MTGDRSHDFNLLLETAKEAAKLALSFWGHPVSTGRKTDGTVVSEADHAVDALLAHKLKSARPDYGWLSEESGEHERRLSCRRVWVVDPIDGTRAFLQGRDDWTVALALLEDRLPILSVVINPVKDEVFEARAGMGAFLNGRRIAASQRCSLTDARIIASDGVLKKPIWREPWPRLTTVWAHSLAYRMSLVACSGLDAAFALAPRWEWDIAAGALLVAEAGGVASTPAGRALHFNNADAQVEGFLAAAPNLHQMLVDRLSGVTVETDVPQGVRI
jgi:myo-inositol-1(or 4)-monophosphatase